MHILQFIQWALGAMIAFYIYKGLLGKLRDGDGLKAGIVAAAWLAATLITSGVIKIN